MARSFNGTTSYLRNANASTNASTMTMCGWVNVDSLASTATFMGMSAGGSANSHMRYLEVPSWSTTTLFAYSCLSADWASGTVGGFSTGTWHHIGGVWDGDASRTAYLNGTAGTTNTTSRAITSATDTVIGAYYSAGSATNFMASSGCEFAIWDVALTAAEMTSLSKGFSPLLIRPANLVSYWPTYGRVSSEMDIVGGLTMTLTGGDANVDHPKVLNYKPVVNVLGITAVASKAMPIFSRPPMFLRRAA